MEKCLYLYYDIVYAQLSWIKYKFYRVEFM